nr:hypothetical protein [Elizabethkingia bruuniana]
MDLDRTNVNLTNLETNRSQLKNAVTLQENALKFYMGMPIEEPIALVKRMCRLIRSYLRIRSTQITELR